MKKIIAGQIMMWTNLAGVVLGYILFQQTGIQSDFVSGLLGFLGVVGSCFNLFISVTLQIKGYKESGIVNLID